MAKVDKIEIDEDLKGVKVRLRRARTFKNPRLFNNWVDAMVYAALEMQLDGELRDALNARAEAATAETPQPEVATEPAAETVDVQVEVDGS